MAARDTLRSEDVQKTIESIVAKLVAAYQPQKVILFGSHAWGNPRGDSDIDLFIIKETTDRLLDRCIAVRRIVSDPNRFVPLEVLVLTPDEVSERVGIGDQFVCEILDSGKVLYAS